MTCNSGGAICSLRIVRLLPMIVLRGEWGMLETVCLEGQVRLTAHDLLRLAVLSAGVGHCLLPLTGAKLSSCTLRAGVNQAAQGRNL